MLYLWLTCAALVIWLPHVQTRTAVPNLRSEPSRLEILLATSHDVSVKSHRVGHMAGRDEAQVTLEAVAAYDRAHPEPLLGGLKVDFGHSSAHCVEYIDNYPAGTNLFGFGSFQQALTWLATRKEELQARWRRIAWPLFGSAASLATAYNSAAPGSGHLTVSVLSAGWYASENEFGVMLDGRPSCRVYYFPGEDLKEIVSAIEKARAILATNSAR